MALPLSSNRAVLVPDGTLTLPGGPSVRLVSPSGPARRGPLEENALPAVEWRETRERFRFRLSAFAGAHGAFERIEIENPHREGRALELEAEVGLPGGGGGARLEGDVLRGAGGEALLVISGAEPTGVRLARGRAGDVRLRVRVVLPPRGRRVVELALGKFHGRAKQLGYTRALNAAVAQWDAARAKAGRAVIPERALAASTDLAMSIILESLAPPADARGGLWVRPGFPPRCGPATLDAVALRALDVWGGGEFVESCLASVFEEQGTAAPPGERFGSARGYLSAPDAGDLRERWASDCGALLWVAASRGDVRASAAYLRSVRRHIAAACRWILGELGPDGLMPPALGPGELGRAGRAWNDAWSWRGLGAAARALGSVRDRAAPEIARRADEYRSRIIEAWGDDDRARPCLETLGVMRPDRRTAAGRSRMAALIEAAARVASGRLSAEARLREAAAFLLSLRRALLADEEATVRLLPGAPREWFEPGAALEFERLPTRFGPVSVRALATRGADRIVVEVDLPPLPRGGPRVELQLGPPAGRRLGDVRVDGRAWRRFRPRAGTVELPPRRSLEVVVTLSPPTRR